jgi:hypothetical protein
MPNYCYLETYLHGPSCGAVVGDMVWFQWGFSPGRLPQPAYIYHLGDAIRWRRAGSGPDGVAPAWTYFEGSARGKGDDLEANLGDPAIADLIVQDPVSYLWRDPTKRPRCPKCGEFLEGAAIEFRDNVIVRAWISAPGELDPTIVHYLVQPDGTRTPMPQWNDHQMTSLEWDPQRPGIATMRLDGVH